MLYRALLVLALMSPCAIGQRDFLTADEIDQVRLAQEPNERLKLYLAFAEQRLALIEQAVAQEKPGRSGLIHDLLEDFTKIIEAIDTVSDDALKRKIDVSEGMKTVAETNALMAARLGKLRDSQPPDISRYEFVLDDAIYTTRDSAELAAEDLGERAREVQARAQKEVEEREVMMRPEDLKAKRQAEKKEAETKRKAPTLRRKGEVPKQR